MKSFNYTHSLALKKTPLSLMGGITLALSLAPLSSHAVDFTTPIDFVTPDASRVVSDPTYLPLQGQVYGTTDYTYSRANGSLSNSAGVQRYSFENKGVTLGQSLAYGVTDDITIRATDTYTPWRKADDQLSSGSNRDTQTDGFADPAFGATWRILDQKYFPVNVDLTGSYAPDIFNAKNPSTTDEGTVARGGDEGTMELAIGHKTTGFTIEGYGGATYLGTRNAYSETNGSTAYGGSSWGYFAGIATQTRFTDVLSLNLGVEYLINHDVSNSNSATDIAYTSDPSNTTDFTAALNYHIIPNRLVAGLTYQYDLYNTNSSTVYANPVSDTSTKNNGENIFGARLQYVFF